LGSSPALADDSPNLAALQAVGLGQSRGDPIPVPVDAPRLRADQQPQAGGAPGRIFVNFDGANLSSGYDDSTSNVTQIGECAGSFSAYGEGAKRDATIQAVRDDWAAYNVLIVESRPDSGDYTMCMVGPSNPFGGGVLGIAPLDCEDQQTHNNITYAFHSVNDSFDASTQATTIGQEVAHSYGLEHVDEAGDIMNPYNAGGDPSFTDQCITIVGGGSIVCGSQHAAECGSAGQQNSHQELLTLFGASAPDNASPTVTITYPADGEEFDAGADFTITVDAADDVGIESVTLYNNGNAQGDDASAPYGWEVNAIPEGTYELYVEAVDLSGNVSMSATVTIGVGGAPATTADDDGTDGGVDDDGGNDSADDGDEGDDGTGGDDGDGDGGVETDDSGLPPGYGLDRDADQGCACRTERVGPGGPQGLPIWLAAVVLLGVVRRRA
jgi:MYXO-CTERM domain-containing protein